jgi:hypothetical protein
MDKVYLPMQKREKISPSKSSALNSPVILDSASWASLSSSAHSSDLANSPYRQRRLLIRDRQRLEVPLSRQHDILAMPPPSRHAQEAPHAASRCPRRSLPKAAGRPVHRAHLRSATSAGQIALVLDQNPLHPGGRLDAISRSPPVSPLRASIICKITSARSISRHARATPIRSTGSSVCAQAGRINHMHRNAFELNRLAQDVPGSARDLGDDGTLLACQPVEQ